jgi:hypothetical protein
MTFRYRRVQPDANPCRVQVLVLGVLGCPQTPTRRRAGVVDRRSRARLTVTVMPVSFQTEVGPKGVGAFARQEFNDIKGLFQIARDCPESGGIGLTAI